MELPALIVFQDIYLKPILVFAFFATFQTVLGVIVKTYAHTAR